MDTTADKTLSVASVPETQGMEQNITDWAQYSQWIAAAMSKRSKPQKAASTNKSDKSTSENQTVKVQGNVTVSYDLAGRTATYLHVPAYQCREGGTVVVGITVNRNGEVIAASIVYGGDECMRSTALKAARESLFDINPSAPARQTGTITYVFIPQ